MRRGLEEHWHNPSSVHRAGQAARQEVELARRAIADLIGAATKNVMFCSGGTEAIDMVLRGAVEIKAARSPGVRPIVATTRVEHAAVRDLVEELEKAGAIDARWIPVDRDGVVDLASVEQAIAGAAIVSVQWANNETGAIQPIAHVAAACERAGVPLHVDGTQWVGKEPTNVTAIPGMTYLTFAPHKFHGPKGVGVVWSRPGAKLRARILGTQELGRRGGTEHVPGIMGAGVAAREAIAWLARQDERTRLAGLRDQFEAAVRAGVADAVINSSGAARLWNTTNIGFPRIEAEALLLMLSERGVCVSAGAACSSGSLEPSPVLLAMGVPPEVAHGSLRFSLSRESTPEEIDEASRIVVECVQRLRASLGVTE